MHVQPSPPAAFGQPWRLPPRGLAVFHGEHHTPRLCHYFMPRLALEGKRILLLDGANCADPRLMARLAERRGIPFAQFNRQIMMARAFTCFQLTELIGRVPQLLAEFPAQVLMVTAFPELYFDEDVRQADAQAAFQQALGHLRHWAGGWGRDETGNSKFETRNSMSSSGSADLFGRSAALPMPIDDCRLTIDPIENRQSKIGHYQSPAPSTLPPAVSVALFSSAPGFQPPAGRKLFFAKTCAAATELWKFQADDQGRLCLTQQHAALAASTERGGDLDLLPSPPWGRGWTATGAFPSRGGPGEGV